MIARASVFQKFGMAKWIIANTYIKIAMAKWRKFVQNWSIDVKFDVHDFVIVFQVSILLVPTCYCLLMTLTIRGCMSPGGTDGIMRYLAPDWKHITQPWVWLEAAKVVFISMQLGMGVISTYASFNKYHHNIIRYG